MPSTKRNGITGEFEMNDFIRGEFEKLIALHKRLLDRAAMGLRPALERDRASVPTARAVATRLLEYGKRNRS